MRRSTRTKIGVIEDTPTYSFFLNTSVTTVNTTEAKRLFHEDKAAVVRSDVLPEGRKVQILLYGERNYAWVAGLYDGSPKDDFPISGEDEEKRKDIPLPKSPTQSA